MYIVWNPSGPVCYWANSEDRAWKEVLSRIGELTDATTEDLKKSGWRCDQISFIVGKEIW